MTRLPFTRVTARSVARLRPVRGTAACAVAIGACLSVPAGSAARAPLVEASVATSGGVLLGPLLVRAKEVRLRVGARRCTIAAGTPLAALAALRAKSPAQVGEITLKDYSGCGKRPSSAARLYLLGIGADLATGPNGWVYGVNDRSGATGAADPAGPFSNGRLKSGQRVAWRWCAASTDPTGGCGDALVIRTIGATVAGAAPAVHTVHVALQVLSGSSGAERPGTLAVAPAGLPVTVTTLTGALLGSGATAADGTAAVTLPLGTSGPVRVSVVKAPVDGLPRTAPAGRLLTIAE